MNMLYGNVVWATESDGSESESTWKDAARRPAAISREQEGNMPHHIPRGFTGRFKTHTTPKMIPSGKESRTRIAGTVHDDQPATHGRVCASRRITVDEPLSMRCCTAMNRLLPTSPMRCGHKHDVHFKRHLHSNRHLNNASSLE